MNPVGGKRKTSEKGAKIKKEYYHKIRPRRFKPKNGHLSRRDILGMIFGFLMFLGIAVVMILFGQKSRHKRARKYIFDLLGIKNN